MVPTPPQQPRFSLPVGSGGMYCQVEQRPGLAFGWIRASSFQSAVVVQHHCSHASAESSAVLGALVSPVT